MAMKTRTRNGLVLAAVLALGAAGALVLAPAASKRSAVEAIPSGAFLAVTVDLAALRASPLAKDSYSLRPSGRRGTLASPLGSASRTSSGLPPR